MAKKRKGKYQPLQSKKKKGRTIPALAVSRPATPPVAEETAAAPVAVEARTAIAQATAVAVKTPELAFELRRIGILAVVMLAALIILVIVLG